ncbi:MAG: DUF563 domain-containing protein [Pyrinomonadaceae bacterium]
MKDDGSKEVKILRNETISRRRPPLNFKQEDLRLFSHEFEKRIPETRLLTFHNVRISSEGILFNGFKMLPDSFAFPANLQQWKHRSRFKFLINNYVLRRTRKIDLPVLWITDDWSSGYFHWVTDVLTRLYVVHAQLDGAVLLLPHEYERREFATSSITAFGWQAVEFIAGDESLLCREVLLPSHTAPSGHYNEALVKGVRHTLLNTFGLSVDDADDRIYISRSRARKRRIINEAEVVDLLREFSFQIIHAEDLSFQQQVTTLSRARYLVSNHGAGLTNMMFMPLDGRVLELRHQTDAINNCYFTLSSALGIDYLYQTCPSVAGSEDAHSADLQVDVDMLRTNLKLLLS